MPQLHFDWRHYARKFAAVQDLFRKPQSPLFHIVTTADRVPSDGDHIAPHHRVMAGAAQPARITAIVQADYGRRDMECTVRWHDGMSFIAETGSGHMVAMDGAPEAGGRNLAPRPMELLLAGTGGCTAFDIVMILKKGRQDVTGCEVKLAAERAAEDPKVFTRINMHFVVSGRDLKPEAVERAVKLSAEKYCSASIMLGKTAEMSHSWEVVAA
jgi:putative redox protein